MIKSADRYAHHRYTGLRVPEEQPGHTVIYCERCHQGRFGDVLRAALYRLRLHCPRCGEVTQHHHSERAEDCTCNVFGRLAEKTAILGENRRTNEETGDNR